VPAHDFQHENARRRARHGSDVKPGFPYAGGHVLGHRPEARAAVRHREVVVHGLGNADADEGVAHLGSDLRDLVGSVGRVVAPVVEEIADVVRLEDFDQALVLGLVFLQAFQLVAARSKSTAGRMAQGPDCRRRFLGRVDEVLGKRADNPVASGVDLADVAAVLTRRFDDAAGGGVDGGGNPAGLCVKGVLSGHKSRSSTERQEFTEKT